MSKIPTSSSVVNTGLDKDNTDWGQFYAARGLKLCPIERGSKGSKQVGWNQPGNQLTEAAEINRQLRQGGIGCVHSESRTATLDLDTDLHLVLWAMGGGATLDLASIIAKHPAWAMTQGNPERPPKLWFSVPEGVDLGKAKKVVWDTPPGLFPKTTLTVLELRCGATQDVLPPSPHPDFLGVSYTWLGTWPEGTTELPPLPLKLQQIFGAHWETVQPYLVDVNPWRTTPGLVDGLKRSSQCIWKPGAAEDIRNRVQKDLKSLQGVQVWGAAATRALEALETIPEPAAIWYQPNTPTKAQAATKEAQSAPEPEGGKDWTEKEHWTAEDWCRAYCEHVKPEDLLARNGYTYDSKAKKWLSPDSTTKEPGVVVLVGDDGRRRAFSHHGSCAIAKACQHSKADALDSWGMVVALEHAGGVRAAIESARLELEALGVQVPKPGQPKATEVAPKAKITPPENEHAELGVGQDRGLRDTTDDGLALALGDAWGGKVRHTPLWAHWHIWKGHRWQHDDTGYHQRTALEFLRDRANTEAMQAQASADPSAQRVAQKTAARLRSAQTLRSVVSLAGIQDRQATAHTEWDRHPWLLATPGGTVDLTTGTLRPAEGSDMLTQCTRVAPAEPGARPTLWLDTLHYLMGGETDPERAESLVAYMQRLCGYMLTGSVEEHVLVFGYGTGRNGKTLVVQTLLELLGDYATTIPASLLMDQRNEQHPTEVARLMGRRVAIGSETERGKRWAEAKLKSLTGGDRITARFMRQDYFEFTPQFKILLVGNAQPNLRNVDVAMRRRLHLLPFEVTVPEERVDPDLPRKLREEGPAILRWMIEGTLEWRRTRLKPPAAVLDATDDYFTEQDTVGLWLAECTEADPHAFARSTEAYGSFQSWCEQNGEPVRSQKWLSGQLKERGIQVIRMRGGSSFAGLRVDKTPGQTGQTP